MKILPLKNDDFGGDQVTVSPSAPPTLSEN